MHRQKQTSCLPRAFVQASEFLLVTAGCMLVVREVLRHARSCAPALLGNESRSRHPCQQQSAVHTNNTVASPNPRPYIRFATGSPTSCRAAPSGVSTSPTQPPPWKIFGHPSSLQKRKMPESQALHSRTRLLLPTLPASCVRH